MSDDDATNGGGSNDALQPDKEFFFYKNREGNRKRVSKFSVIIEHLELIDLKYLKAEALSRQLAGISTGTVSTGNTVNALLAHNSKLLADRYMKLLSEKEELEVQNEELSTQLASSNEKIEELKSECEVLENRLNEASLSGALKSEGELNADLEIENEALDVEGAHNMMYSDKKKKSSVARQLIRSSDEQLEIDLRKAIAESLKQQKGVVVRNVPQMKIEYFHGKYGEDFKIWYDRFLHAALPQGWDDETKRIVMIGNLRDAASQWYMSRGKNILDWPSFLAAFRKQFDRDMTMPEWTAGLNTIKLKENQSITEYVCMKMAFIEKCPSVLDVKSKVQYAWSGLPPDITFQFMTRNCLTFEDCLDFADSIDRMRQEVGPSLKKDAVSLNKSESSNNSNSSNRPERPSGITDKTNPEYGLQRFNSRRSVSEMICYRCNKKGHITRNCTNRNDRYDGKPKPKSFSLAVSDQGSENVETPKEKVGCTFEIIQSPIACIPIMMNKVKTHACDDHGSSLTFVDKKILDPSDLVKLKPWTGGFIGMVNSTSFKPLGELENVKITLGDCETIMKVAVIENNMVPVLLGDDFRSQCKLRITCFEGKRCYQRLNENGEFECVVRNEFDEGCNASMHFEKFEKFDGPKGLKGRDAYRAFCDKNSKEKKIANIDIANAPIRIGPIPELLLKQQQSQGTSMAVTNQDIDQAVEQEEYDALLGACGFRWDAKDGKFH